MKWIAIFTCCIFISSCAKKTSINSAFDSRHEEIMLRESINLMTYNIRLDVVSDGENAWSFRKKMLIDQVLFLCPDIIGVQEATPSQMKDLKASLPKYSAIGIGRDGGDNGEYSAIFYNHTRLKVEQEATFWLSETPEIPSFGWDAACHRICTYGLFSNLANNNQFWVFNTHLDHQGHKAQQNGMLLVLDKVETLTKENEQTFVMGDLNVEPENDIIKNAKESLSDTKEIAEASFGPTGTFNGFNHNEIATRRIDYIFLSKPSLYKVEKYAVLSTFIDLRFPSDHFPVFITATPK